MDRRDAGVGVAETATVGAPPVARIVKARSGGRRRSCNRCSSKKERCDGQEPCQRCMRSGWECLYATCRTLGRPRNSALPAKRRTPTASPASKSSPSVSEAPSACVPAAKLATPSSTTKKVIGRGSSTALPKAGASSPRQVKPAVLAAADRLQAAAAAGGQRKTKVRKFSGRGSTSIAPTSPNTVPLKRASFSPSSATGLVGMVQNRFLTCFLHDFSSLYGVLDDVTIRLGLINLMTGKVDLDAVGSVVDFSTTLASPSTKRAAREGAAGSDVRASKEEEPSVVSKTEHADEAAGGGGQMLFSSPGVSHQEDYGINSAVFSAMAIGALMLGQQPSQVEEYSAVAKASLHHCGALSVTVPNEKVAVAQFLLGIASDIAGGSDYPECIQLARDCYENLERCGRRCNPAMRNALKYRRIIDALAKPSSTRIPAPDSTGSKPPPEGTNTRLPSKKYVSSPTVCSSPAMEEGLPEQAEECAHPEAREGQDTDVQTRNWSNASAAGRDDVGESDDGDGGSRGGDAKVPSLRPHSEGGGVLRHGVNGLTDDECPPGVEAARKRSGQRKADCLLMVSDIMTVLSRVPWSRQSEDRARRTRQELMELRSLLVTEKSLLEERRRSARVGKESISSDSMGLFALANAFIGLHCALEEFEDLLPHARAVTACISKCPGLARYQVHGFHVALEILRAFGRREEFSDLLAAGPKEIRSLASNSPIEFDAEVELCSRHVCVMHCKAIRQMGDRYLGEALAADGDDSGEFSSMALASSASTPTASGAKLERVGGESVVTVLRGTEASPSQDGGRLSCTPYQLSPAIDPKLERNDVDVSPQRPPANRPLDFRSIESQTRRPGTRSRWQMGGSQWAPSTTHRKQSSFSPSWVSPSQPIMVAPSAPVNIGTEIGPLESISPPPFSGSAGQIGIASSLNEGGRLLRPSGVALPPYSRLSSVCGSDAGGVLSPMHLAPPPTGGRQIISFSEALRQAQPSLTRARGDWDGPRSDAHTRSSGSFALTTGRRFAGDSTSGTNPGDGPVEGSASGLPLPSLRFSPGTSGIGWASVGQRNLVGGISSSSVVRERGRVGITEGYFDEPLRDHFAGGSPSTGEDEATHRVTRSREPPSSLTVEESNVRTGVQATEAPQDSSPVPFGGGATSTTARSSPGNPVREGGEEMTPQLWETTVQQSGRVLNNSSSTGANEEFPHQAMLPPSEALEGDAPFWQWGSPPQEISSPPPPASSSAIPAPPTEYGPIASSGKPLQQTSAPLPTTMSSTLPTSSYSTRRSSDSTDAWRSEDDRLLSASSAPSPVSQDDAAAVGSAANAPEVIAISSSSSPPAVGVGPAASPSVPTGSSGISNRSGTNARVAGSVDGTGGQDDHMFMDLLELMDNGDNQENAH